MVGAIVACTTMNVVTEQRPSLTIFCIDLRLGLLESGC
jgi:hypothetical protein